MRRLLPQRAPCGCFPTVPSCWDSLGDVCFLHLPLRCQGGWRGSWRRVVQKPECRRRKRRWAYLHVACLWGAGCLCSPAVCRAWCEHSQRGAPGRLRHDLLAPWHPRRSAGDVVECFLGVVSQHSPLADLGAGRVCMLAPQRVSLVCDGMRTMTGEHKANFTF